MPSGLPSKSGSGRNPECGCHSKSAPIQHQRRPSGGSRPGRNFYKSLLALTVIDQDRGKTRQNTREEKQPRFFPASSAFFLSDLCGQRLSASGRREDGKRRVPGLIRRNFRLMLQRESDVVQPVQQAMADEVVDVELRPESLVVPHLALLEINRELVVINLLRSLHEFRNLSLAQPDRKETILGAVVGENVGERRRDHRPEAEVAERPHRMFTRRSTSKILPRDQNARAFVAWLIEHEVGIFLSVRVKPPVIKHKLPKARALDPLQKLLRDDLVSIHVDPIQRRHAPAMHCERFHLVILIVLPVWLPVRWRHPERSRSSGGARDLTRISTDHAGEI